MTGTSHLIFGIGSGIVAAVMSPSLSLAHIPLVGIAALLPDIDSSSSRMGRRFKIIGSIFGHRGFFHTPLFLSPFLFIPNKGIGLSFVLGITSHLFLDLMNKGGVMLFWPFSKKKYRIAELRCGAWLESAIVLLLLTLEIAVVFFIEGRFT